jgi:hypothetical protein
VLAACEVPEEDWLHRSEDEGLPVACDPSDIGTRDGEEVLGFELFRFFPVGTL